MAQATGIERTVEAVTEEAIVRAIESPAVERALARVLKGPVVEEAMQDAIDSAAVSNFPPLSVTLTVKLLVPAVPGVPDMVPPTERLNPAGNAPVATVHVYGVAPPVAATLCE